VHIGDLLYTLGNHSDALAEFEQAFAVCVKCMGEDNVSVLATELISSGRIQHSKGQYQEANRDFMNAFAMFKEALGYDHEVGNCHGKNIHNAQTDLNDVQGIFEGLLEDLSTPNSSANIQNLVRTALNCASIEHNDDLLVKQCKLCLKLDDVLPDSNLDCDISAKSKGRGKI
jgi:tetratricopeptide (TPR) repeat protein